jgi:hypothetical protein
MKFEVENYWEDFGWNDAVFHNITIFDISLGNSYIYLCLLNFCMWLWFEKSDNKGGKKNGKKKSGRHG